MAGRLAGGQACKRLAKKLAGGKAAGLKASRRES